MKILIFSNYAAGLYKFRKELLEKLVNINNEVYVSIPNNDYVSKLQKLSCKFVETHVDRRGTNPIKDLKLLYEYICKINHIKPDIVLTYTVKPNVYGGMACRITKTPYIANITGLGTSIENKGLIQKITLTLYKAGIKRASCVFFQNEPNRQFFIKNNILNNNSRLIPGSGVNLKHHKFEEYPNDDGSIRFLFIGRIMKSKGIEELLKAAEKVKKEYPNVQFDILGGSEEDYIQNLAELNEAGVITYHGLQEDVHSFIKKSHATILPSYHEGTANVLLESASSGRPVLASKVTGCIETFDEGVSGYGFEVKSVDSLVETIIKFIKLTHEEKKVMGIAGRKKMEKEYDRNFVIDAYINEINSIKENRMWTYMSELQIDKKKSH